MEAQQISFLDIDSIPKLIKDFLQQQVPESETAFFNLKNVEKSMNEKETYFSSDKRMLISEVFQKQYAGFTLSEKQQKNIDSLQKKQTFTIVTGHQLNLFSGPVFFVYKILQTIKTAEFLKEKFPNADFVPVFWMASEDHDFDEINHFRTKEHFYEFKAQAGGPVGRIEVQDQFFIHEFEKEFRDTIYGTELIRWMKEAYTEGNSLSLAIRTLVQRLFSDYGLLCLDGDDAQLKQLIIPTFQQELVDEKVFNATKERISYLEKTYGKVQVNPREINLFYLSETRNRIEKRGSDYFIVDKDLKFSETEILEELHQFPEKFSPNALLRPVYQETVLPNIAYVGGNAEIMYWLELTPYFAEIQLPFPILIPRNSMLFLSEKTMSKMDRLDLKLTDFFGNFAQIIHSKLLKDSPIQAELDNQKLKLQSIFDAMKKVSSQTDVTFGNLVSAEETRQLKAFDRMQKRLLKAEKIKHQEKIERIETLFLEIHPGKIWQERIFNFSVFYSDHGAEWLHNCYQNMDVEKSGIIIMTI